MNKIHYIKRISGLLLCTALMFSCSSEDDGNATMKDDSRTLKIEATMADTRAVVTGTTFSEGDKIGIYVTEKYGTWYEEWAQNVLTSYDGVAWKMRDELQVKEDVSPYVSAYYPYSEGTFVTMEEGHYAPKVTIDINPDVVTEGQADWLYASAWPSKSSAYTAKLTFNHALARVTLGIKKSATDVGKGVISKVRVTNADMYKGDVLLGKNNRLFTKGYMSLETGEITRIEDDSDTILILNQSLTLTEQYQDIDLLLMPSNANPYYTGGGYNIELTIDGFPYVMNINPTTLQAGRRYYYRVAVNRKTIIDRVDLGILSDSGKPLYWATRNVGAEFPEEYGGYYAWGETEEKEDYSWKTYKWCKGTHTSMTKYCLDSSYGTVDNKKNLEPEDDVAHVIWGKNWRMPTQSEYQKLLEKCIWVWSELNGVKGYTVKANNGCEIFLPAAGRYDGVNSYNCGSGGYYWCNTLYSSRSFYAYYLLFSDGYKNWDSWIGRNVGYSIRSVTESISDIPETTTALIVSEAADITPWEPNNQDEIIVGNENEVTKDLDISIDGGGAPELPELQI